MEPADPYLDQLKEIVLANVDRDSTAVFLFGGRARGRSGKNVDVDLGLLSKGPIDLQVMLDLRRKIDDSIIPYKVDIVDFFRADPEFKKIALKEWVIWNKPPTIEIS